MTDSQALEDVEHIFPKAKGEIEITSPRDQRYNCIAWAAEDVHRFWWPTYPGYWPPDVPYEATLQAFKMAYAMLGYEECDSGSLEDDYQKVAIYANSAGVPTHASRQLNNGRWTSKLGPQWDISHSRCESLEGDTYGHVALFMKRRRIEE